MPNGTDRKPLAKLPFTYYSQPRVGLKVAALWKTCSSQDQGLTRADTYAGGMDRFVADQTSQLGVAYQWARGVNIPLTTEKRVDNLRFAKSRNIPAVIEYPAGTLSIHYSIVKEWFRTSSGYYAIATNHTSRVINMGDSLNGETGTFLVYKK